MAELPLGYRFKPTNTQLVGYYLTYKLKGKPMPSPNPIMDYDVYSDHPYNILAKTKGVKEDEKGVMEGYFFNRLKKATPKGKKISRYIKDHGTWSNKSTPKNVYDDAMAVIGKDRYFKFLPDEKKKNDHANNKEWKMHEYSISENDLVLCYITNKADSSKDGDNSSRALKRNRDEYVIMGSNYEIGSSSKRGRVEYGSSDRTSALTPHDYQNQQYTMPHHGVHDQQYIMPHGYQDEQHSTPHHGLHQQKKMMPNELHQQYSMPYQGLQDQQYNMPHSYQDQQYMMPELHQQYTIPHGYDLRDQQYNMPHGSDDGHVDTTNEALGDEQDRVIASEPHMVQGGTMCCNDEQATTSLNYSLSKCVNDNMQVPQVDYQIHEEISDEALVEELEGMLSDDEKDDTNNNGDNSLEEDTTNEAFIEEIEALLSDDEKDDTNNNAAIDPQDDNGLEEDTTSEVFIEEIENMLSDIHEAQGEQYDEQDMTTITEPHLVQVGEYCNQDTMQVEPEEVQINDAHQEQDFSIGNTGAQENTSWRFNYSLTAGCDYNANKLGFEHEDDDVDFSTWLHALVAA